MIDLTKPVRTRDGRKARVVATDMNGSEGDTVLALITEPDGNEYAYEFKADGSYYCPADPSHNDLVQAPEQRRRYFNAADAYSEACHAAAKNTRDKWDVFEVIEENGEIVSTRRIPKDSPELVRS